jgi:glycosyltransferase involved in cell wall biosynthesis
MPVFNGATHIATSIDAILSQTYAAREIIVVDDGSTDETPEILGRYGEAIRTIRTENGGVQAARNVGIAHATGDWIATCDHDDVWLPGYLGKVSRMLRADPGIEFCFTNFLYSRFGKIDPRPKFDDAPDGFWDMTRRRIMTEGWVFEGSIAANSVIFQPIFPSAMVFSKSLVEEVGGYDTRMRGLRNEDYEFTLRCLYRARTAAVPQPLVVIRRHATNSSRDQVMLLVDEIRSFEFIKEHHPDSRPFHPMIDESIVKRRLQAIDGAFAQCNHALARRLFGKLGDAPQSAKLRAKRAVVGLPDPVGLPLNWVLQAATAASGVGTHILARRRTGGTRRGKLSRLTPAT